MKDFSKTLLKWYETNKRDLPWRNTKDPYPIWLSEVILQQTRVDQGMDYYYRFLTLFPDVKSLADASEDQVLKAWQGLGYYSRARNLHATSKIINELHNGVFPQTAAELLKLKGIGPYTAAAIASFAWNEKVPVVDGNVMRVISRLFGIETPVDSPAGRTQILETLNKIIDHHTPGLFNQAIMEFGALQCTPSNPGCSDCPFQKRCIAWKGGLVDQLPVKSQKTKVKDVWIAFFHVSHKNKTYLHRRTEKGIWQGLYDFPSLSFPKKTNEKQTIEAFLRDHFSGSKPAILAVSHEYVHLLSHRKIHAVFYQVEIQKAWRNLPENVLEVNKSELHQFGIPRLIDRYLQDIEK